MKLLSLILGISGWTLPVESQAQNGLKAASNINQDLIFFSDNRPRPVSRTGTDRTSVVVQKSVEPHNPEQDSYTQAIYGIQNYSPYAAETLPQQSNHIQKTPSLSSNLQPPQYDVNNPNYSSGFNDNSNVGINGIRNGEVGQTLPTVKNHLQITNVSLALSNFGLNVLRNVNQGGANVVVSPFSIAELLSLLQQGALGLTQQQISEALQMAPHTSVEVFHNINENLKKRNSHNILRVASNVFVADVFELSPAFKRIAMRSFNSEVTSMKFERSEQAVSQINHWVSRKTNNKIMNLLRPDAVGENTQAVLVNAVYFKGLWAVRFKPDSTLPRDFYINSVEKKTTPFMRIRKIFRTGTDPTNRAQVIILPFENEQYSLIVVLPSSASNLDAVVSRLTGAQLASYNSFTPKEVDLEIPKFSARADTDLNPVLRKMGVTNAFGPQAELSGLGTYQKFSPQLSSALHTAMLSIDEDGGSAAAATSFAVVALSYDDPSISFKANRPFLAVLWDNESALPLFMAKILNPTS